MKLNRLLIISALILFFSCEKESDPIPAYSLLNISGWKLSSTPLRFPESSLFNDLRYNANRARIGVIDPIIADDLSPLTRQYYKGDFGKTPADDYQHALNISYYPKNRGMYNLDAESTEYSDGIDENGCLNDPRFRWGGIQTMAYSDLKQFGYIDFWLQNPFRTGQDAEGYLVINYGQISEDILKDGMMAHEADYGIYAPEYYLSTAFGQQLNWFNEHYYEAFSADPGIRVRQDVGLDGLSDEAELEFFADRLEAMAGICLAEAMELILNDPCSDNFTHYMQSSAVDILEKYYSYNGLENNSPVDNGDNYFGSATPDSEDLNKDHSLQNSDAYFEYRLLLDEGLLYPGENHIEEIMEIDGVEWLHIVIPTNHYDTCYGTPERFGSVRIYLTGFNSEIHLRLIDPKLRD